MPRINVHKRFGTASYLFRHSTLHYDRLMRWCYLRLEACRSFHRCLSPSPMTTNAQTPAKCTAIELAIFLSITDLVPSTFQFSPPILRLMLYTQFTPQFMPQGSTTVKTKCVSNDLLPGRGTLTGRLLSLGMDFSTHFCVYPAFRILSNVSVSKPIVVMKARSLRLWYGFCQGLPLGSQGSDMS